MASTIPRSELDFILNEFVDQLIEMMINDGRCDNADKTAIVDPETKKKEVRNKICSMLGIYIMDDGRRLGFLKGLLEITGHSDDFIKRYGEMKYKGVF